MNEIYYCKQIWKERDHSLSRGDTGYVEKDIDLPELIGRKRFLKSQVTAWADFIENEEDICFKNKEPKIRVMFLDMNCCIILVKIEDFDKVMETYYEGITQFKHN